MSTQLRERVMSDTDKALEFIETIKDMEKNGLVFSKRIVGYGEILDLIESQRSELEKLQSKNAALLTAAKLAHGRLVASGGDAISINALNKAIEGCKI